MEDHLTESEIYDAIVAARGNLYRAAKDLGITRSKLHLRAMAVPSLVSLLEDIRESILDEAETNQFAEVEKGDPAASRFVLTTLGRRRGYATTVAGEGKNGEITIVIKEFTPGDAPTEDK